MIPHPNRLLFPLASLLLFFFGCQGEKAKLTPSGYWSDSTGMAMFEIKSKGKDLFEVSSSLGSISGQMQNQTIQGKTDLNDAFLIELKGDSLVYSILGVSMTYYRISQERYDSLARSLTE